MRTLLVVLCLAAAASAASAAASKDLPASWKKCRRSDPKVGECLNEAVLSAVKELTGNGLKELGVFPVDPLFISQVDIGQGRGPVSLDLHFSDLYIIGLKSLKLPKPLQVQFPQRFRWHGPAGVPEGLTLKGKYKVNGKVLVLPIQGEGDCELRLENPTGLFDVNARYLTNGGEKYAEVTDFGVAFNTTRLRMRFDNLFNGNAELSTQMNKFLNDNWVDILQELKPGVLEAFGGAFKEIANRIFLKVPFDKLFLP